MPANDTNIQASEALRIVLPVIYSLIAIISIIGNLIVLQIICANRFRHKSYHILVTGIAFADLFYTAIFFVVRTVSYAYSNTSWFINVTQWCKAEMYLLRLFDFILGYTIVFLCLDRTVSPSNCCFGIRRLRSGIVISLSIWMVSSYILIPILLFDQEIVEQKYGGYLCKTTDASVTLSWLSGNVLNPRMTLDFVDFIFRICVPIFFMLFFMIAICCRNDLKVYFLRKSGQKASAANAIRRKANAGTSTEETEREILKNLYPRRLNYLVISLAFVFMICQLPYEVYQTVLLWQSDIKSDINDKSIDYAIEMPLLILKIINRAVNPFLFMCLADENLLRRGCCRLWCLPCCPCCIGCQKCWCQDCYETVRYEINHCLGLNNQEDNLLRVYIDEDVSIDRNIYRKNPVANDSSIILEDINLREASTSRNNLNRFKF
jgi:hypothetical protein